MHEPELSFKIWALLESLEWKFLPFPGSLLDQPEWLLDDLMIISKRKRDVQELMDGSAKTKAPTDSSQ